MKTNTIIEHNNTQREEIIIQFQILNNSLQFNCIR